MVTWDSFIRRIQRDAASHRLKAPCPPERILQVSEELRGMPPCIHSMLNSFNGGKLFARAMPMVTLFGLSTTTDSGAVDWFIDVWTPKWRAADGATDDWVFGITNYGGVLVIRSDNSVRQWDGAARRWEGDSVPLNVWTEQILLEGEKYMTDEDLDA